MPKDVSKKKKKKEGTLKLSKLEKDDDKRRA